MRVRRFVAVFAMVLFALTRLVVSAQNEDRNKDKNAGKKSFSISERGVVLPPVM